MNSPLPAPRRPWARPLATVVVALAVIAVAAAAFVFSYAGVHAIALFGGVSAGLARYYPGLFDAVLVIACVAAVVLRDGRWWARLWAWLVALVVLGSIGTADVLHAAGYTLRHRPTESVVAAAPVVAVLLAFSLLLTMLRQSKNTGSAGRALPDLAGPHELADVPALPAAVTAPAPAIALPAAAADSSGTRSMPLPEDPSLLEDQPLDEAVLPADEPRPAPTVEVLVLEVPVPEGLVLEGPVVAGQVPAAHSWDGDSPDDSLPGDATGEAFPQDAPPPGAEPDDSESSLLTPPDGLPVLRRPVRGIRYAGGRLPGQPDGSPGTGEEQAAPNYWETEEAGQFAGLVYAAHDEDAGHGALAQPGPAQEIDEDAPPFATAPFNSFPRLNRVRSTPAPPEDEDEDARE